MSFAPTGRFWISNQGTNSSTLYDGGNPLIVDVPHAGPPAGPAGQMFAGGPGLTVPGGAIFLFANLDGSISAWDPE